MQQALSPGDMEKAGGATSDTIKSMSGNFVVRDEGMVMYTPL